jgi:hypothetical protein
MSRWSRAMSDHANGRKVLLFALFCMIEDIFGRSRFGSRKSLKLVSVGGKLSFCIKTRSSWEREKCVSTPSQALSPQVAAINMQKREMIHVFALNTAAQQVFLFHGKTWTIELPVLIMSL